MTSEFLNPTGHPAHPGHEPPTTILSYTTKCDLTTAQDSPPGSVPGGLCGAGLLAVQEPHVGGLGALGPRRHVELDGLALIK